MEAQVLKTHRDKNTGAVNYPGSIIDIDKDRFLELWSASGGPYAEAVNPDDMPELPNTPGTPGPKGEPGERGTLTFSVTESFYTVLPNMRKGDLIVNASAKTINVTNYSTLDPFSIGEIDTISEYSITLINKGVVGAQGKDGVNGTRIFAVQSDIAKIPGGMLGDLVLNSGSEDINLGIYFPMTGYGEVAAKPGDLWQPDLWAVEGDFLVPQSGFKGNIRGSQGPAGIAVGQYEIAGGDTHTTGFMTWDGGTVTLIAACFTSPEDGVSGTAYWLWTPQLGTPTIGLEKLFDAGGVGDKITFSEGNINQRLVIKNNSTSVCRLTITQLGEQQPELLDAADNP